MQRLYSTLCFFFISLFTFAQNESGAGSIKGIITAEYKPAVSVTVRVKETKKTTLTNNEGAFIITNLQPGNYSLEISSVGFQSMEKEVNVTTNNITDVSIQLSDAQTQLSEVIVSAGRTKETIDEVPSSVSIVGLKTLLLNPVLGARPDTLFSRMSPRLLVMLT